MEFPNNDGFRGPQPKTQDRPILPSFHSNFDSTRALNQQPLYRPAQAWQYSHSYSNLHSPNMDKNGSFPPPNLHPQPTIPSLNTMNMGPGNLVPPKHADSTFPHPSGPETPSFHSNRMDIKNLLSLPSTPIENPEIRIETNRDTNTIIIHEIKPPNPHTCPTFSVPMPSQHQHQYRKKSVPTKYMLDPEKTYIELAPIINASKPSNICELLMATLRECSHQVPLDDFFDLLYEEDMFNPVAVKSIGYKVDKSERKHKKEGLRLCQLILKTFRAPGVEVAPFARGLIHNPLIFSIKYSEIRRNFIAMKILLDCIEKIEDPHATSSGLSRSSIKQAYSTICQKLVVKHPSYSKKSSSNSTILVGQSQLGRIIKLVYPDLITRRIGKRGESSYYYVGIQWNKDIVDDEMLQLLGPETAYSIRNSKLSTATSTNSREQSPSTKPEPESWSFDYASPGAGLLSTEICSFVAPESKFPTTDCSPRLWDTELGCIPKQSEWALETMLKSATALKKLEVDVSSLIEKFETNILADDGSRTLSKLLVEISDNLFEKKAPEEGFLQFYLVILLLIFPVCLATNEEISCPDKSRLRENLKEFSNFFVYYAHKNVHETSNYLNNLTKLIGMMIHLTQLSQSSVKKSSVGKIAGQIAFENQSPSSNFYSLSIGKEGFILRSTAMAIETALGERCHDWSKSKSPDYEDVVLAMANDYSKYCEVGCQKILRISEGTNFKNSKDKFYDFPFQMFKTSVVGLHEFWLSQPSVSNFSLPVISSVGLRVNKEIQNRSFMSFAEINDQPSKETFQTWWVYSAIMEEYMGILSEVVALSERLFPSQQS